MPVPAPSHHAASPPPPPSTAAAAATTAAVATQTLELPMRREPHVGSYSPSWGFRLQGGADFGTPLIVQKVSNDLLAFVFALAALGLR